MSSSPRSVASDTIACVRQALNKTKIEVTEEQCELLARHLDLVLSYNERLNLTRITDPTEAAYLHVADSLLLLSAVEGAPRGVLLDIGTGGGFPGLPLAIVSGRKSVLADSVRKKVAAVDEFVHELGLARRVTTEATRVEELAKRRRGGFSVVTARAVAQSNVLVEYAAPLLCRNGRLVVAKARPSREELDAADRAAKLCGMKRVSRETFELPDERGHREVIVYERVGNPSVKLPRNTGMAQHHPLGM